MAADWDAAIGPFRPNSLPRSCLGQGLQADTASMDLPTGRCARQRSITANAAAAELGEEEFGNRREP